KGGRYVFAVEDDVIETRFRQIGENDYAVQLDEGDGEGAQYFWGHAAGESFSLVMMWCSDLPRALVDSLIDAGGMATDDDYTTCEVKTVDALVAAAASYAAGEAVSDGGLTMTRAAAAE
ncbi:MAG TPA: hypothetical protein PKH09_13750, partial [Parvularculaceae bacterium]|nr:hypothetical protein [Parvularculaceae bacterium]